MTVIEDPPEALQPVEPMVPSALTPGELGTPPNPTVHENGATP